MSQLAGVSLALNPQNPQRLAVPRKGLIVALLILALFAGVVLWLAFKPRGFVADWPGIEGSEPWSEGGEGDVPGIGTTGGIAAPVANNLPEPTNSEEAFAQKLCQGDLSVLAGAPATLFGHRRNPAAPDAALIAPPPGFGAGGCARIHGSMIEPLRALLAAARAEDPALGAAIVGLSCHRDPPRQAQLYCAPGKIATRGYAGQAYWVAPPGYSEHATGLSLDFGDRNRPDCHVEPCFGETRVGRWLAANAGRFGFRLSFPPGNAAGIAAEPWHFRYTGGGIRQMQVRIAEDSPGGEGPDAPGSDTVEPSVEDAPPPALDIVPLDPAGR